MLKALVLPNRQIEGLPYRVGGEVDAHALVYDDLLPARVERIPGRNCHLARARLPRLQLQAADDSPAVKESIVASSLLPQIELFLLEIVDTDGLADEVARTFAHGVFEEVDRG